MEEFFRDLKPVFLEENGFEPVEREVERGGNWWGDKGESGSGGSGGTGSGGEGSLEVSDGGFRAGVLPGTFQTLFIGKGARENLTFLL